MAEETRQGVPVNQILELVRWMVAQAPNKRMPFGLGPFIGVNEEGLQFEVYEDVPIGDCLSYAFTGLAQVYCLTNK